MIIKRGKCEIVEVIKDKDHNIDDIGTKESLAKIKEDVEKNKLIKNNSFENN